MNGIYVHLCIYVTLLGVVTTSRTTHEEGGSVYVNDAFL